jgi:hypothetical protein
LVFIASDYEWHLRNAFPIHPSSPAMECRTTTTRREKEKEVFFV